MWCSYVLWPRGGQISREDYVKSGAAVPHKKSQNQKSKKLVNGIKNSRNVIVFDFLKKIVGKSIDLKKRYLDKKTILRLDFWNEYGTVPLDRLIKKYIPEKLIQKYHLKW